MRRMLATEPAELLVLHPSTLRLLVLCRRVVPAFALSAFKCDNFSHALSNVITFSSVELATGIEPVTSSLPRKCSTN